MEESSHFRSEGVNATQWMNGWVTQTVWTLRKRDKTSILTVLQYIDQTEIPPPKSGHQIWMRWDEFRKYAQLRWHVASVQTLSALDGSKFSHLTVWGSTGLWHVRTDTLHPRRYRDTEIYLSGTCRGDEYTYWSLALRPKSPSAKRKRNELHTIVMNHNLACKCNLKSGLRYCIGNSCATGTVFGVHNMNMGQKIVL